MSPNVSTEGVILCISIGGVHQFINFIPKQLESLLKKIQRCILNSSQGNHISPMAEGLTKWINVKIPIIIEYLVILTVRQSRLLMNINPEIFNEHSKLNSSKASLLTWNNSCSLTSKSWDSIFVFWNNSLASLSLPEW